ncbi:MAG: pilin, partial [Patescibacteria group bacterium]
MLFSFFFFPDFAFAQTAQEGLKQVGDAAGPILPQTELLTIVANLIKTFLGFLGILLVLIVMYAGYQYIMSGGDAAKMLKARKMVYQAVVGLALILSSYAIVAFIFNILLNAQNGQVINVAQSPKYQEPLAGSLGAGIIESHYPPRNANEIPRNTMIFLTFKQPINPVTLIQGFDANKEEDAVDQSKLLNNTNVWIFETASGQSTKLASDKVKVTVTDDHKTFVFDPVDYLGNDQKDTNITIGLQPGIKKDDGTNAFTGTEASGYGWTFTVSTELDLTPPKVQKVFPMQDDAPNVTIEMTFDEAMNPVSSTGQYVLGAPPLFTNISVLDVGQTPPNEQGRFEISNGYKTIGFTTTRTCGKDPCGDYIYCLAPSQEIRVIARAATIDVANPPQASLFGASYDGLTDAAGNS